MLALFEVHAVPGLDLGELFSAEVLADTGAQVMTLAQAKAVGFGGLDALESSGNLYLVAVAEKDAPFIGTRLEASHVVSRFRLHHVDA